MLVPSIEVYPKRHGGSGAYGLDAHDSTLACATVNRCVAAPKPPARHTATTTILG